MKCKKCSEEIVEGDIAKYKSSNYHKSCLVQKLMAQKKEPLSQIEADIYVESLYKEQMGKLALQKSKDELFYYVSEKYGIAKMTTRYFQTIENFVKLKYDLGVIKQMLERENFQAKLNNAHRKRGMTSKEELKGESRWNYDVVLINKYYHNFIEYLEAIKNQNIINSKITNEKDILKRIKEQQDKIRQQGFQNRYSKYFFED